MLIFEEDRAGYINVYDEGDNYRGSICVNVFNPGECSFTAEELTQIDDYINRQSSI